MNRRIALAVSVGLLALAACGGGKAGPEPPTHVISGTITRAWGGALAGVEVRLGGDATGSDVTDAGGRFTFPGTRDGTYTLAPQLAGWVFSPAAPTVVVGGADRTQDFTADGAYTISGTVTVSGVPIGGVSIALSGGGVVKPAATSAAVTGAYQLTGIPNGTYTLTPTLAGYAFTPAAATVTVTGANATQGFAGVASLRIAGTVRWGPDPLPGATVRLTGARTALATTDAAGAYAFEGLSTSQTYTVTPATFGFAFQPAPRTYTLAGSVADADFTADAAGPLGTALHGTLSYAGTRTGPVYVTVTGQLGPGSPLGGTGLAAQAGPWSARAYDVRNLQAFGMVRVRAWMDTLGVGRFVAGADPSVTFDFDTASGAPNLPLGVLADPAAPAVASAIALNQVVAGDGTAVAIFDPPTDAAGDLVADGYRVYWNDQATVDAGHTLGTITVEAGSDFAVVRGLANGTPYWFAVEAWLGGAAIPGQLAATAAPVTPAAPSGTATVSGTVGHPAVAAPSALYVVAQSGQKGPAAGVWWQRIPDPSGTQTDYTLRVPPGTYVIFAFVDVGDDGAVGLGEPARFPDQVTSFFTAAAGANVGPAISLPGGAATARLATARFATAFFAGASLDLAVASAGKVPLAAVVTGPGLRGPLDLGLQSDAGGIGVTLGTSFDPAPIFPVTGDVYTFQVTYADGTAETFQRPVTGSFGGPPGVVAPPDGAVGVAAVPTFEWSAPPGASGSYGWVLELASLAGDQPVWGTFLPGAQTSVVYDADGGAASPALGPLTDYGWNIIAIDGDGNRAGYGASFTTGAPALPLFDALDGAALDGQRWLTPQFGRAVAGGKAVLSVQADQMQERAVQGAVYNNAINVLNGGQRVTTLRATVGVPAAGLSRTGGAVVAGGVRLLYQPAANRGQPFPAGNLNLLVAGLELYDDGSGLRLRRRFYHCDDAACVPPRGAGITAADPAGFTLDGVSAWAPAAADTPYTFELSLDEGTGVFTWSVQGGAFATPVTGTADASTWAQGVGLVFASAANGFLNAQAYTRAHDDASGSSGRLTAEYDDVAVGFDGGAASPWDDFASPALRVDRWGAVDGDAWLAGGSLHLASEATVAATTPLGGTTTVNVMSPASFLAWQADVAIVTDEVAAVPASGNAAGLVGACYNDGTPGTGATGDVRARVTLQSGAAGWSIFRCPNAGCTGVLQAASGILAPSPGHPLGVGTVHTLLLAWDPAARLFTFRLDDGPVERIDPTTLVAPVASTAPRSPLQLLTTSVTIGAGANPGTTARVEATFDDLRATTR